MSSQAAAPTVGDLVKERPRRAWVFEKFGISYCSSGKASLEEACSRAGVAAEEVRSELARCDAGPAAGKTDWEACSLTELADSIEATHHAWLRTALPRLGAMLEKVSRVHGNRRPELHGVHATFRGLREELEMHMIKEERILFPMLRQLETLNSLPQFHCGSVRNPIGVMEHEHSDARDALARMRELTGGFVPPEGACATYCATLDGLAELEADLLVHIAKEDGILFPKGAALEEELRLKSDGRRLSA